LQTGAYATADTLAVPGTKAEFTGVRADSQVAAVQAPCGRPVAVGRALLPEPALPLDPLHAVNAIVNATSAAKVAGKRPFRVIRITAS